MGATTMPQSIAVICLVLAGVLWILARSLKRSMRRRRPGLPPPDRATIRDCFKPVARQ